MDACKFKSLIKSAYDDILIHPRFTKFSLFLPMKWERLQIFTKILQIFIDKIFYFCDYGKNFLFKNNKKNILPKGGSILLWISN